MKPSHDEREEHAVVRPAARGTLALVPVTVGSFPRYDQYTTPRLLAAYEAAPGRIRAAVAGLGLEELRAHPRAGKWSILEVACHLTDSELMGAARVRLISAQPGAPFTAYDQAVWAAELRYDGFPLERLQTALDLFELLRRSTLPLFTEATDGDWTARWGTHPSFGAVTLRNLLELYADHGERHLEQILVLRRLLNRPIELEILLRERLY
jgi:hypothetical protein